VQQATNFTKMYSSLYRPILIFLIQFYLYTLYVNTCVYLYTYKNVMFDLLTLVAILIIISQNFNISMSKCTLLSTFYI